MNPDQVNVFLTLIAKYDVKFVRPSVDCLVEGCDGWLKGFIKSARSKPEFWIDDLDAVLALIKELGVPHVCKLDSENVYGRVLSFNVEYQGKKMVFFQSTLIFALTFDLYLEYKNEWIFGSQYSDMSWYFVGDALRKNRSASFKKHRDEFEKVFKKTGDCHVHISQPLFVLSLESDKLELNITSKAFTKHVLEQKPFPSLVKKIYPNAYRSVLHGEKKGHMMCIPFQYDSGHWLNGRLVSGVVTVQPHDTIGKITLGGGSSTLLIPSGESPHAMDRKLRKKYRVAKTMHLEIATDYDVDDNNDWCILGTRIKTFL
jgi:hypothetical protein